MNNTRKKYKKPKQRTQATTNPEAKSVRSSSDESSEPKSPPHLSPLLAKDSEWVDIHAPSPAPCDLTLSVPEEEVLQLVDCEDGPEMKPLAIMFPGILENDPETLQSMLNAGMSTTEVTKQLVNLGQKANLTFMKKADRLIKDKKHLESVIEDDTSHSSVKFKINNAHKAGSDYEADNKVTSDITHKPGAKRRVKVKSAHVGPNVAGNDDLNVEKAKKTVMGHILNIESLNSETESPERHFVTTKSDTGYDADVDTLNGSSESINANKIINM